MIDHIFVSTSVAISTNKCKNELMHARLRFQISRVYRKLI